MPRTVAVSEVKAHCVRLVEEVARQGHELVVTKRGKPIARLVPMSAPDAESTLAGLRGTLIGGERIEDFGTDVVWESARR